MRIYIDQGVNQKELRKLKESYTFEVVQTDLEQQFPMTEKVNKGFMIGASIIGGPDVIAGDEIPKLERAIGRCNHEDIAHVHSAWLNKCDYFVTNNPGDFVKNGKREELEAVLSPLKIRTLGEFIGELGTGKIG